MPKAQNYCPKSLSTIFQSPLYGFGRAPLPVMGKGNAALPAWNQMILKAVFVGSPLHQIWGLEARANPELARMLVDYAHERWAAKRPVNPELWRLVGPFADAAIVTDLERVFNQSDVVQQEAAALACSQSTLPQAQALLARRPDLHSLIEEGHLTWTSFSEDRLATCL